MAPIISADNVSKHFLKDERRIVALEQLSLTVEEGSFVVLLGRSGCGKSTLLNMIAGLSTPTAGNVSYRGTSYDKPLPQLGYLTQKDTLMPWRNLRKNIAMPLEFRGMSKADRKHRADELIKRVSLAGFERHYPRELSGGMLRRASLARMLCVDPEVLLLDEPFGALDALLRAELQAELMQLWQGSRRTVIFVTHDLDEALLLGDRVITLGRAGRINLDEPIDFARPRDLDELRLTPEFVTKHQRVSASLEEATR